MNSDEKYVLDLFINYGFKIEKIKETNQKTPDFIVYDNDKSYLIELKFNTDGSDPAY